MVPLVNIDQYWTRSFQSGFNRPLDEMWWAYGLIAFLLSTSIQTTWTQRWAQQPDDKSGLSPFFFFCRPGYNTLADLRKIRVEVAGNPTAYRPATVYKISVWLDEQFDSHLVTAVFSTESSAKPFSIGGADTERNQRKMCAILSSSDGQHPSFKITFFWMSPPQETGCVDFVATFARREVALIRDGRIHRMCPESEDMSVGDLKLSGAYQEGVIFRDDFESGEFDSALWVNYEGVDINGLCDPIFYGQSVSFCQRKAYAMKMSTIPLNLTTAGVLQFGVGRTSCPTVTALESAKNVAANVTILYSQLDPETNLCTRWMFLQNISLSKGREAVVHVIPLPAIVRRPDVCIQWSVAPIENLCMGVDDVIITNAYDRPSTLNVQFDPFRASDWIFFPGGTVTNLCHGDGRSLVFNASSRRANWATSRDLKLTADPSSDEYLWKADFDRLLPEDSWEFTSASISDEKSCAGERMLIIHPNDHVSACSSPIDLTSGGNIRFRMKPWEGCGQNGEQPQQDEPPVQQQQQQQQEEEEIEQQTVTKQPMVIFKNSTEKLNVWIDNDKRYTILQGIFLRDEPVSMSLTVPIDAQKPNSRICWHLVTDSKPGKSRSVNDIVLLPTFPSFIEQILQFRLHMNCPASTSQPGNSTADENPFNLIVQYSRDQGRQWNMLNSLCLPPTCTSSHSATQSSWSSDEISPWERFTLPMPYAALSEPVRIRFIQKGRGPDGIHWALDDLHLSSCYQGCYGHGTCVDQQCVCDEGYDGQHCEATVTDLPDSISEEFESLKSIGRHFLKYSGATFGASCGTVSMGNAAIFSGPASRQLQTIDLNTMQAEILKFALRTGGPANYARNCPGPDRPVESIYVHSSCNGGLTWSLMWVVAPSSRDRSQLITLPLNSTAKGVSCRFKIWQPHHSGVGKDLWSLDDFYVGVNRVNYLVFNSSAPDSTAFVGQLVFGPYCHRQNVLLVQPSTSIVAKSGSDSSAVLSLMLETFPLRIDSFSMVQLEATAGCTLSSDPDDSISLQFSTDNGGTWTHLLNYGNFTDWVEYDSTMKSWKRITLKPPAESWSPSTRFRVVVSGKASSSMLNMDGGRHLAIDYFYAGPECPELCRGNGRCSLDGCVCDEGFHQSNCLPSTPLFPWTRSNETILVKGGREKGLSSSDRDSCHVHGTTNFLFDSSGIRMLETKDFEYSAGTAVHFILRLGYCDDQTAAELRNVTDIQIRLQVSWNGGSDWLLLREYQYPFFSTPRLDTVEIPAPGIWPWTFVENAELFKLRLVQTGVQSRFRNVWTVAGFGITANATIYKASELDSIDDPLETHQDLWIVRNVPEPKESCSSEDLHCRSKLEWYGAITKPILLQKGDTVQFDLVSKTEPSVASKWQDEIRFEFSTNGGSSWNLVQNSCHRTWLNCQQMQRPSVISYKALRPGTEERFAYFVHKEMAERTVLLRWSHWNDRQNEHQLSSFEIRHLYLGPPCPSLCSGHGRCLKGSCTCDPGHSGSDCSRSDTENVVSFIENFGPDKLLESKQTQPERWSRLIGGRLVADVCKPNHHRPNRLVFFEDKGPRLIQTVEINTERIRMVRFTIGLTAVKIYKTSCHAKLTARKNQHGNSSVSLRSASSIVVEFSTNNGLTWNFLDTVLFDTSTERLVHLVLPAAARTRATVLRWWQIESSEDPSRRLDWYMDDVIFNFNETNPSTFEYETSADHETTSELREGEPNHALAVDTVSDWLSLQGLLNDEPTPSGLLQFNGAAEASAETWDMEISPSTLVQFELIFPNLSTATYSRVHFEYSTDGGHRWHLVHDDSCFTNRLDEDDCEHLHFTSQYHLTRERNLTRVTIPLPRRAISPATRFRWILAKTEPVEYNNNHPTWALGHVYIGGSICPWMCSGHGTCHGGVCKCDPGYGNGDCVSKEPLPKAVIENFDPLALRLPTKTAVALNGGGVSNMCGVLVSGESAVFHQNGLRYMETSDLNMVTASYLQFSVKFNCWRENFTSTDNKRLLLLYSVNGGITWHLLKIIKYKADQNPQHLTLNLMNRVELTNATRLRLWQPLHSGDGNDTWAVDGFFLHDSAALSDPNKSSRLAFEEPDDWLAWFGGSVQKYCQKENALVFHGERGENGAFTKDVAITSDTVIQFQINVGCNSSHQPDFAVRLEFSADGGATWNLVVPDIQLSENLYEKTVRKTPSIYYQSTSSQWKRVVVPLTHLGLFGSIRFRWYHGYLDIKDSLNIPTWAIADVYIGPQCPDNCHGHGTCVQGSVCLCDPQFEGELCDRWTGGSATQIYHETFSDDPDSSFWSLKSGGRVSDSPHGAGKALGFNQPGVRRLETRDLNLTNANFVEFYLDFGQSERNGVKDANGSQLNEPRHILMEYSTNGGIDWSLMQILGRRRRRHTKPKMWQVNVPSRSATAGARLRWSQPGLISHVQNDVWMIDEVFIGGEFYALDKLEEQFTSGQSLRDQWLLITGGQLGPSCNSNSSLHFRHDGSKTVKMATTRDIRMAGNMHLQFEISVGCNQPTSCSKIVLEYSIDYGQSWNKIPSDCRFSDDLGKCSAYSLSSEFLSDATGHRRTVHLDLNFIKGIARFRWSDGDNPKYDWSLHRVYIGAQCGGCSGRGRCVQGKCVCQPDWTGQDCNQAIKPLMSSFRETFSVGHPGNVWARIQGATVSSFCGAVYNGPSLHFHEGCHRYAETVELDLRQVDVIQFHFRANCGQSAARDGQVLFQFSSKGGLKWTTGLTLYLDDFSTPKLVSYVVPSQAKLSAGVKLRWWQSASKGRAFQDWAIDSLITDGPLRLATKEAGQHQQASSANPGSLKAIKPLNILEWDLQMDQGNQTSRTASVDLHRTYGERLWWRKVNIVAQKSLCKQDGSILQGTSNMEEESLLETVDIVLDDLPPKSQLQFDLLVGHCDETFQPSANHRFPLRFEISFDHGVTWRLFQRLNLRGESLGAPHVPSVYFPTNKWMTFAYPTEHLAGFRIARFRWINRRSSPFKWSIKQFYLGTPPSPMEQVFGRSSLMEDFNSGSLDEHKWMLMTGGKLVMPSTRLAGGRVALFQGDGLRLLMSKPLDLRSAEAVQFTMHLSRDRHADSFQRRVASVIYLQCSTDKGTTWTILQEFPASHFLNGPNVAHANLVAKCKSPLTLLRWWQPYDPDLDDGTESYIPPMTWAIDNILVDRSDNHMAEIHDPMRPNGGNQSTWQFYPLDTSTDHMCTDEDRSIAFKNAKGDGLELGLVSWRISLRDSYAAYFKIKTACPGDKITACHGGRGQVRFEMRKGFESPSWTLVQSQCLPDDETSGRFCLPNIFHEASVYASNSLVNWQRIVIPLRPVSLSTSWQFRWISDNQTSGQWALKDVYIGPMCPLHCNNHGDCVSGVCHCDEGYKGLSCQSVGASTVIKFPVLENFDNGPFSSSAALWEKIEGASIKVGCGSLIPQSHGKHLHFDGCSSRSATTVAIDVAKVSHIAFVLRTGTSQQLPTCRIQPSSVNTSSSLNRAVLLQYSFDGVQWFLLASHSQRDFIVPRRLMYNIPSQFRYATIRFRWWQPRHGGPTWDQWAIDNVELLP